MSQKNSCIQYVHILLKASKCLKGKGAVEDLDFKTGGPGC